MPVRVYHSMQFRFLLIFPFRFATFRWVKHGEDSVAFRVASWRQQKADEADSNIAMTKDSKFMAFVTNKSVHNRKHFAQHLRQAAPEDGFTCVGFLQVIYEIVSNMHSPCMRLECKLICSLLIFKHFCGNVILLP